jgi:predicted nucleic acid-binding protein
MKLPDAIIAGSAMNQNSILLTEDKLLLSHQDIHSQSYA